jgi:uncharacterized protein (TIGR00369 family)
MMAANEARTTMATKSGVVPLDAFRSHDGLTVLRGVLRGDYPPPPITDVLPFTLTEVDKGRVAFEGTPSETLYNPMGAVHGGFAMTLLDSAMTCAVMSALAAGELCTTIETKVSFVRPVLASTGPLRAEAHVIHAGSRVATAEGRLTDAGGRLYAHGTSTCLRFPL